MKTYELTLKPKTGFATPLKGDTLFGQFCWEIYEHEKDIGKYLVELLHNYNKEPFVIFSSAIPKYKENGKFIYLFKQPAIPSFFIKKEKQDEITKRKKDVFLILSEDERITNINEAKLDIPKFMKKTYIEFTQWHNTINRLLGTTTKDRFAPFTVQQIVFNPEIELSIFIGINEKMISINEVNELLSIIGKTGFGKDASNGLGKFDVVNYMEINLFNLGSSSYNACYTIAPCVPEKNTVNKEKTYFVPFVRYGRHGNILAKSSNPFKNPVVMMDDGAIVTPSNSDTFNKPYLGKAIRSLSKVEPNTVMQGYSLYIPVYMEED